MKAEGAFAIVLVDEEEIKINIPRQLLPPGARESNWLKIVLELDPEDTKKQEAKVKGLLES